MTVILGPLIVRFVSESLIVEGHMERSRVMFFVNFFKYIAVPFMVQNYGVATRMVLIDA